MARERTYNSPSLKSMCLVPELRERREQENESGDHNMTDREAGRAWSSGLSRHEISHLGLLNHRAQSRNGMGNEVGETEGPGIKARVESWRRQGFTGADQVATGGQANNLTAL